MSLQVVVTDRNSVVVSAPGPQGPQGAAGSGSGSGTVTSITAGTGLSGGTITTSGTIAVSYGTSASTACEGNDSRLSDARTPTTHSHVAADIGSVLGPGLVGRSAASSGTCERIGLGSGLEIDGSKNLALTTTPAAQSISLTAGTGLTGGGDLSANRSFAVSFGTSASTACEGNDSRLSDARTPTSHTHALSDLTQSSATTGQVPTWNGSAWAAATPSGSGTSEAETLLLFTDWISNNEWYRSTSGGAVLCGSDASGVLYLRTGTAASTNQRAAIASSLERTEFSFDEETSYEWCSSVRTESNFGSGADAGFYVMGFMDSQNQTADSNGVLFRSTDGGNWYGVTVAGGTETATDTGVALSTSYARFRISVLTVGGTLTARFYVDGTLKATHTTNIPISTNRTGWGLRVVRTGNGGLQNSMYSDWMRIAIDRTTNLVFT